MKNLLRLLANNFYWQSIYARSKEISGIKIFNNDEDFSKIQVDFLHWLEIYASLYQDLYSKEPFISEEVINDDIRVDAYLYLKNKNRGKKDQVKDKKSIPDNNSKIPSVIFKGKK